MDVEDGATPTTNGRLADAPRADWRLRIGNVQGGPLHVDGDVQNCRRLVLVKPFGQHLTVVGVEHPLLADCMADAESRPAEHLAAKGRLRRVAVLSFTPMAAAMRVFQ